MAIGDTSDNSRYPVRKLMGVQVLAIGSCVPDVVVTNEDLQAKHGFDPEWIVQRTGIRERRHAPPGVASSDLAVTASQQCMQRAGVQAADIDLLIVGTFTPDMTLPSAACLVQDRLGLRAPAVDMSAGCAGFVYSLVTAAQYVATGCSKLALVVGVDCTSKILDPKDQRTFPLFGDGAGAVLLTAGSQDQGLVSYQLGSDGAGAVLLNRPVCGSKLPPTEELIREGMHYAKMDGRAVFKWAVRVVDDSVRSVLRGAGMSSHELDLIVLHQANVRIIDAAVDMLELDREKLVINLDRYGNTSGGSVPLALDEAFQQGRIHRGDNILLSGFGAGLAWGTAILRW